MPIPEKYKSIRSRHDNLLRLAGYLESEVEWNIFNEFALAAYHLYEWVLNDAATTPDIVRDVEALRNGLELQACRDAANTYKHRKLTEKHKNHPPQTKETDVSQGLWGNGRFGKGGWGTGEEQITITMKDGTVFDGLDLSRRVVKLWDDFFNKHPNMFMK